MTPKSLSGAATNRTDTSPANVARVLREYADTCGRDGRHGKEQGLLSLADALDALPTQKERGDWGDCLKCSAQLNHEDDPQATGLCPACRALTTVTPPHITVTVWGGVVTDVESDTPITYTVVDND